MKEAVSVITWGIGFLLALDSCYTQMVLLHGSEDEIKEVTDNMLSIGVSEKDCFRFARYTGVIGIIIEVIGVLLCFLLSEA